MRIKTIPNKIKINMKTQNNNKRTIWMVIKSIISNLSLVGLASSIVSLLAVGLFKYLWYKGLFSRGAFDITEYFTVGVYVISLRMLIKAFIQALLELCDLPNFTLRDVLFCLGKEDFFNEKSNGSFLGKRPYNTKLPSNMAMDSEYGSTSSASASASASTDTTSKAHNVSGGQVDSNVSFSAKSDIMFSSINEMLEQHTKLANVNRQYLSDSKKENCVPDMLNNINEISKRLKNINDNTGDSIKDVLGNFNNREGKNYKSIAHRHRVALNLFFEATNDFNKHNVSYDRALRLAQDQEKLVTEENKLLAELDELRCNVLDRCKNLEYADNIRERRSLSKQINQIRASSKQNRLFVMSELDKLMNKNKEFASEIDKLNK